MPHELLNAFRVCDDEGRTFVVEQWATVTHTRGTRFVGEGIYYLRDGTRLLPNLDGTLSHASTGQRLHRLRYPPKDT